MLDYSILKAKPYLEIENDSDGSSTMKIKDLLSNVINPTTALSDCTAITVTEPYVARPDLISLVMYGDDKYADILCKINGISNPFELNENMIMIIPDITAVQSMIIQGKPSAKVTEDSTITKTVKTNRKQNNQKRSPGEQTTSDTNFIIDKKNRLVIY